MPKLIICEKPQASLKIALALADTSPTKHSINKVPYYELTHKGKRIIVSCAVGHLYGLREKNKGKWDYPIFDVEWTETYLINKTAKFTKKYLDTIKKLSKDVKEFYLATDKDLEGETIGFNILRFACKVNDAKRMEFSTLTAPDLINAFENPKPHLDFPLIDSGITRHTMDFFYGVNSSRALILALKSVGQFKILSSGRVQSPVLALLTKREEEILKFEPVPYWQLFAFILAENNEIKTIHKENKFWKEVEAKKIFEKCKNHDAKVIRVLKKEFKTLPPTPFNITSLQTEAYRLFKFSPKQTLDIAQSLYLLAFISYPRTSSEKLSPKIGYKNILSALTKIKDFKNLAEKILSKRTLKPRQGTKSDPAHIAIYPTSTVPNFDSLNDLQRKIYPLIVKRFLSCFADPAVRESLEIKFDINKEIFVTKGTRTLEPGWTSFYEPYAKFQEMVLPDLKEGEIYKVKKLNLLKDETKPPRRYTQGSIIAEMESKNLGTRSTRGQILQILYDRLYIEDRSIKVTKLGIAVAETLEKYVPDLVSEKLTRHFEKEMEQIREQKKKKEAVLAEAKEVLTKILKEFKKKEKEIGKSLLEAIRETQNQSNIVGKCPNCKGNLRIMYSKKTKKKFLACDQYPKCKTTMSLPQGKILPTKKICKFCKTPIIKVIRKGKRPFEMCLTYDCESKKNWKNFNNNP